MLLLSFFILKFTSADHEEPPLDELLPYEPLILTSYELPFSLVLFDLLFTLTPKLPSAFTFPLSLLTLPSTVFSIFPDSILYFASPVDLLPSTVVLPPIVNVFSFSPLLDPISTFPENVILLSLLDSFGVFPPEFFSAFI